MIKPCDCKHEYQDNKYGKGKRVFNKTMKDKGRCTVCGLENHSLTGEESKDKKKR